MGVRRAKKEEKTKNKVEVCTTKTERTLTGWQTYGTSEARAADANKECGNNLWRAYVPQSYKAWSRQMRWDESSKELGTIMYRKSKYSDTLHTYSMMLEKPKFPDTGRLWSPRVVKAARAKLLLYLGQPCTVQWCTISDCKWSEAEKHGHCERMHCVSRYAAPVLCTIHPSDRTFDPYNYGRRPPYTFLQIYGDTCCHGCGTTSLYGSVMWLDVLGLHNTYVTWA